MMTSRIEVPLQKRLRASSYPDKKLPLPRDTGNTDNLPDKRAMAQKAFADGSIARTFLPPGCEFISEKELSQLESLLNQKIISHEPKDEELCFDYKNEESDPSGLPEQFIKDLNRSELSITINNQNHKIKSAGQYKELLSILPEENKKLVGVISAITDQGFFADNYNLLYEKLAESFTCSNNAPYKIMVSINNSKEENDLSKVVTIRGEIEYELSIIKDNGGRAQIRDIRITGVVEKVFSDNHEGNSIIKFDAKAEKNFVTITPAKRDRSQTQPAIPLRDRQWVSDTFKNGEDDTSHSTNKDDASHSTESTSIMSDFEIEDEGSMAPIPKIISSDTGFIKTDKDAVSLPSIKSSKASTKPSFFARIRQAWSDITETVVSYWQRLKSFFSL
ncbi:hypothetical protein F3I35_15990 [Pantoea sp. Bo_7]|uniref:hypothetical protein n=1 Tax=unclassified Pantoea TaxID=2630326 RepID=UPI001231A024|nr:MULTISPECIES: hypothetical protein [unclassified Pantoea]KAA6043272.1 hypothetical protein F3I35_15990 [Pantoea sp. Bo_7]KAA6088141.1 hypothetical protein F3I22_15835 [Pantoea sp. Bo_10]